MRKYDLKTLIVVALVAGLVGDRLNVWAKLNTMFRKGA